MWEGAAHLHSGAASITADGESYRGKKICQKVEQKRIDWGPNYRYCPGEGAGSGVTQLGARSGVLNAKSCAETHQELGLAS